MPKSKLRLKIAVNICRALLALTLLLSGFLKANDPVGTGIKIDEYIAALGFDDAGGFPSVVVGIALAFVELALGAHIAVARHRRFTSMVAVGFMGMMTLVSVWIAIDNPVSDCGCFADAIVLTNVQTLLKNIVLLAAAVCIFRWYRLQPQMSAGWSWLVVLISMIASLLFAVRCLYMGPLIDFSPYKVGTNLTQAVLGATADDAAGSRLQFETKIIYRRGDETLELDADADDPDSTWEYVETRSTPVGAFNANQSNHHLDSGNFYIADPISDEDITADVLQQQGDVFLLILPDMENADQGSAGNINAAYDYALAHDIPFYCLTASDTAAQQRWTDYTGAEYEYYRSDRQVLQTMVRSNPGLILLTDGVIANKWTCTQIPLFEE